MKILAVGDLIGNAGVKEMRKQVNEIMSKEDIDFVIVNGENSAEGMGITEKNFKDILDSNVDVITMGNHTWGKKDIFKFIDRKEIIRPANYPKGVPGRGYNIYTCRGKKIAVINLMGRVDIIVIDFHAEATAEKIALGKFLDGEATIIYGTHTHVQTADEKILKKGTGYITDLGMTGPENSVIGMDIGVTLKRFETALPERYRIAEGECIFNGVIFEIDNVSNKVVNIRRINK